MSNIVTGVECNFSGRHFEIPYDEKLSAKPGEVVVFRDSEGKEELGTLKFLCRNSVSEEDVLKDSKVLRIATANDLQKISSYDEKRHEAIAGCKNLVDKHGLEMQVFRAGYSFDGKKLHFSFTADDRVDFRELVKDLATVFKKQIYLRQVGPRDRASMLGGYGRCGRQRCATSFLRCLESINMDMVREQGLEGRGSSKLSGPCGKLLCCLKYEVELYRELKKNLPNIDDKVFLKKEVAPAEQEGIVIAVDILNQKLRVLLKSRDILFANASDVQKIMRGGKYVSYDYSNPAGKAIDSGLSPVSKQTVDTFMESEWGKLTK